MDNHYLTNEEELALIDSLQVGMMFQCSDVEML